MSILLADALIMAPNINLANSALIVRLEDYTRSEEIGLLDEGIDRYLGISPDRAFAFELEEPKIRDNKFRRTRASTSDFCASTSQETLL